MTAVGNTCVALVSPSSSTCSPCLSSLSCLTPSECHVSLEDFDLDMIVELLSSSLCVKTTRRAVVGLQHRHVAHQSRRLLKIPGVTQVFRNDTLSLEVGQRGVM